ncbi:MULTISPECIES: hypothetical protein [unclassified Mycobacterium]|uniref:hypothetical protein n=1 Tax=unclassified Mycobacterium TaxID=2642494 RepID=UPI0008018809|nr:MULTISPECIES: hypothetical protein [unclassified Mycobacterium]OBG71236.1 hypothetical protein A5700_12315 [Mycobacterium sp. E1214]OBH22077.1 hypothetical protein A5693_14710 [Mycobacterium sp. E1319]
MAAPADAALTVLVAPHRHTDELIGVLNDYSAAGLLGAFVWVDADDARGPATTATMVRDGRPEVVVLQQVLSAKPYQRVRVAVLVPLDAPAEQRAPLAAEQHVEQVVRSTARGAGVTLLRMLLTTGRGAASQSDLSVVVEGWHNLLVAPEDSPAPGLGAVPWGQLAEPLDLAQRAAPVVAAVAGLWADVQQTPFDSVEILPGQTVRTVRAFYRSLDTADVEKRLRARLFDPGGRLPLPHGGQVPVLYLEDVAAAGQAMARALWTKHRDVLRGARLGDDAVPTQAISIWAALKMFLRFMGGALRNAPSAWLSAVKGSVSAVLASTVQGTVFGGRESAFSVVTSNQPADWQDLGRSADSLNAALGGPGGGGHLAQQDLSPLWTDFVNGALTLADGGRRAKGLEPIHVGSGVGVLANAADVVPSRADRFTAIPTSLAAVIGVSELEPADVLGVADLRQRLQRAYSDPAAGVEARGASTELDRWQQHASRSYAWQAGSILADFLGRARAEVAQIAEQIQRAAGEISIDERVRARQQAISTILATLTWATLGVLVVLTGVAVAGFAGWTFPLVTGGVLLGLYILVSLALFLFAQRDLFTLMNLQKSQQNRLELMHANLQNALQDVSRLSTAYGQFLSWCRALGPVLRAPFGPAPAGRPTAPLIADGLPRCAQIGVADPGPERADDAAHAIQRRLYSLGWLTKPWQDMVGHAAARLREEPEMLYRMPGFRTGSGLDQWSEAVAAGHVQSTGADALWQRVEQMFASDDGVGSALTGAVLAPAAGQHIPAGQFSAGVVDHRPGHAAPFDGSVFTDAAMTAGRSAVAIDTATLTRTGLGYRAAVVQASDGLAPYDFTLFELPVAAPSALDTDATSVITHTDHRDVPPGGDLVF